MKPTQALEQIYQQCLSNCWIDCFGVLVEPKSNGKKLLPLADMVHCEGCNEHDYYALMIPDDSRKSVAYFEQSGDISITEAKEIGRGWRYAETKVNLVVWYNMNKLGYLDESIKDYITGDLLKRLDGCKCNAVDHPYLGSIDLCLTSCLSADPFKKYNYDRKCLDILPYEWLHLQFDLKYSFNSKCLPDFECKDEVICN